MIDSCQNFNLLGQFYEVNNCSCFYSYGYRVTHNYTKQLSYHKGYQTMKSSLRSLNEAIITNHHVVK